MNYTQFKNKWLNNRIDYDSAYGYQCFDVINQYILEITGKRPQMKLLNASDIWFKPENIIPYGVRCQHIENTPLFVPIQGDIVIWSKASWNGFYGHAGIIESSTLSSGVVLQQDGFNPNTTVKLVNWNWNTHNFIGVIRLLGQMVEETPSDIETRVVNNYSQLRLKQGGWRSQVIEEIINAKLWSGTWKDNEQRFLQLNFTGTPKGGWESGDWINYDYTQPPLQQVSNPIETRVIDGYSQLRLKKGGWRSDAIREIINAKLWQGTWQENEQRFLQLNFTGTPQGGWKSGDWVNYDYTPPTHPTQPVEIATTDSSISSQTTIETTTSSDTIADMTENFVDDVSTHTTEKIIEEEKNDSFDINKVLIDLPRANIDKASLATAIGFVLIAINEHYQIGLNTDSIAQFAGIIACLLVAGGIWRQNNKK